jgi:hypothetical protein
MDVMHLEMSPDRVLRRVLILLIINYIFRVSQLRTKSAS